MVGSQVSAYRRSLATRGLESPQVDCMPHRLVLTDGHRIPLCLVLILPSSRQIVAWHVRDRSAESLIAMYLGWLANLGAVPAAIPFDNMSAWGRRSAPDAGD